MIAAIASARSHSTRTVAKTIRGAVPVRMILAAALARREPAERRLQVERPVSGPLDFHHEATPSYWLLRSRRRRKIPAPISPRLARNVPSSEKPVNGSVFPCVVTAAATPELGPFDDGGVNADGVVVG